MSESEYWTPTGSGCRRRYRDLVARQGRSSVVRASGGRLRGSLVAAMLRNTISAFRITSAGDEQTEIDSTLGMTASHWSEKDSAGGRYREKYGGGRSSIWYWRSSIPEETEAETHVSEIASLLEERSRTMGFDFSAQPWETEVVIGVFCDASQGGLTFGPEILERLGRLGVGLQVDIWLDDSDEEDQDQGDQDQGDQDQGGSPAHTGMEGFV